MMNRLRDEAGMTLMEVMIAATVGTVVMLALFGMLDTSVRLNAGAMSKTDAMQRGRLAMDSMTQELRSQVCLVDVTPAIGEGSDSDHVDFYNDFSDGDGSERPTKRRLVFDPETGDIKTEIHSATVQEPGRNQFTNAPTSIQMRFENAALQAEPDPAAPPGTPGTRDIPFLRYFAYQWVGNPPRPEATEELPVPLTEPDARRVARIDIAFVARPTGAEDSEHGVELTDRVMARHSDPNLALWDPANPSLPDPRCI
jgi:hypothetical protein